jgi:hypothetical protein
MQCRIGIQKDLTHLMTLSGDKAFEQVTSAFLLQHTDLVLVSFVELIDD